MIKKIITFVVLVLENSDSNDDENVMARSQAIRPHVYRIHNEALNSNYL